MSKSRSVFGRRMQAIFLCLLILLSSLLSPTAFATESESRKTVKVGFFAFEGYHMMDDEGNRSGYGYDFLRLISRYMDVDYEYVGYDKGWDDMLEMLSDGRIDMVTSAQVTSERLEEFAFSKPIGASSAMLTVSSNNKSIISEEYDTYDGIRIALLENNSRNEDLERFASEKGFSYTLKYYSTASELEQALRSGEVDAALTSSLRRTKNERVLDLFDTQDFYAVVRKDDTELLNEINYAIDQVNATEGDWKNHLNNKHYSHLDEKDLTFTSREQALINQYINGEKTLIITGSPDRSPYTYVENGELKGIIVDYFAELAEYIGIPYEVAVPSDREEYQRWQKEGPPVVFIDSRVASEQWVEENSFSYSQPYTTMRLAMVTRRDFNGEINTLAVATSQGLFGIEEGIAPNAERLEVSTRTDAMQAVLDGKADAAVVYLYTAQQFVNQDARGLLTYTMLEEPTYEYHVGFTKNASHELAGIFTKAIYAMPEETFENIASQYISYKAQDIDMITWIKIHPIPTLAIGAAILLVVFLIVMLMERQKAVKREQERSAQLQELAALADSANHAKTMFLNNMSHDIRTPMNAIIGFTSLAASNLDNPQRLKEYLQKISVSSEHLLSLINDVLDMSRIESGKVKIDAKPLYLPDLMHDIRTIVQPTITSKQLNFVIDTVDVRDENIIADKLRLNQILLNMLSNGVKFNKIGGMVSLRVKQLPKAPAGCATYEFVVRDTGIGMKQEFADHIFDAFAREETATVSGIPGTGLGMTITKNIVDMMGGTIRVESKEDVGSAFTVTLTFRLSGDPVVYEKIDQLQGLRVLVADDDTDTCLNVSGMLNEIGMRPEWTTTGKEAVIRAKYAYESGNEFSAYIIDWLMPDMNGIETVRRIRRVIGEGKPIIILTAYDWADVEVEAREAGVTAFCEKPLFMSELRDILSQPFRAAKAKESPKSVALSGKRVLLVEDNQLNQEIACTILEEMGVEVETADDGSVALEMLKTAACGHYDVILMDIQMPFMDGYETTRHIREFSDPVKASIPIIAMTANAFSADQEKAMDCGMNGYLIKPISAKVMADVIGDVLER